jgi:hypothetical protein
MKLVLRRLRAPRRLRVQLSERRRSDRIQSAEVRSRDRRVFYADRRLFYDDAGRASSGAQGSFRIHMQGVIS